MKPIKFKHCNNVEAPGEQSNNIPSLKLPGKRGEVVTCYSLSLWERIRVLWFGVVWLGLETHNRPIQSQKMTTKRKDLYFINDVSEKEIEAYAKNLSRQQKRNLGRQDAKIIKMSQN